MNLPSSAALTLAAMPTVYGATDLPSFTASQLTEMNANAFIKLLSCASLRAKHESHIVHLGFEIQLAATAEIFLQRYPRTLHQEMMRKAMDLSTKAAVNPGTTTEPAWAAPLAAVRPLVTAFVELSRSASLIGKLMPRASRVPFNVSVPVVTGGGTYRWVGQAAPKPVGNMQLQSTTLPIAKSSGLVVLSAEIVDLVAPGSDVLVRNELIRGISTYLDAQLTDPTVAAVSGVSPASITNAAPSIGSAGTSAANALTDIKALIAAFIAANPNAASVALLMSPAVATALAVASNSQTLGPDGGTLYGIPVLTGAIGSRVVILDPTALLIADDDGLDITISRQGTVEFDTVATSPPTASTVMVSLWQQGLVGFKIDRFVAWKMARANSAMYTNVAYV